jgi:hypothetical protein
MAMVLVVSLVASAMVTPAPPMVFTALSSAATELDVRATTSCPSAEQVAERVRPLLPSDEALPEGMFLWVGEVPSTAPGLIDVEVRLERAGGDEPVASRRFERAGSCVDMAETIAVVVASWAGHYDTPAPTPLALPATDAGGARAFSVDKAIGKAGAPASSSLASQLKLSLGAVTWAVGASEGGVTPHAGLEVTGLSGSSPWFGRLAVAVSGERTVAFAGGDAVWRRGLLAASVGRSFGRVPIVELDAGALVGPVLVRGQGFMPNDSQVGVDVGVAPSLRLGVGLGRLPATVWIGGAAAFWMRAHRVWIDAQRDRKTLPRVDVMVGGGVTFSLAR